MKTSAVMVSAMQAALLERTGFGARRWHVELAMQTALADVPDPYEVTSQLVNADRKVAALEAKLAKVRAWRWEADGEEFPKLGTLDAILDGKDAP